MISIPHGTLNEIVQQQPLLVAQMLNQSLGVKLPSFHLVRAEPADLTDLVPTEYLADSVVVFEFRRRRPVLGVEVRPDPEKWWSWPAYVTNLRRRRRCPTLLLVICVNTAVARWCAKAIDIGHPGWELSPVVLGPDRVPLVTEADQARQCPELAVLSALAHANIRNDTR